LSATGRICVEFCSLFNDVTGKKFAMTGQSYEIISQIVPWYKKGFA